MRVKYINIPQYKPNPTKKKKKEKKKNLELKIENWKFENFQILICVSDFVLLLYYISVLDISKDNVSFLLQKCHTKNNFLALLLQNRQRFNKHTDIKRDNQTDRDRLKGIIRQTVLRYWIMDLKSC